MSKGAHSSTELVELLLLPVIRFCLRRSIKIQEFMEVSRHLYVRAAEESLKRDGYESNVSRIAVATGLQRREVTRLWRDEAEIRPEQSLLHKIIGQWEGDRRFSDKEGRAKKLSFKGVESEFADLVRSVSQDLNIYTVLFELERLGLIEKRGEQLVLIGEAVNPGRDVKRGLKLLSDDMSDLISAVEGNLFHDLPLPNHHTKTHYDNIIVEALPKIRDWFLSHGEKFHREARAFLSKYDKDLQPRLQSKLGKARVAIGSYSITSHISKKKGK